MLGWKKTVHCIGEEFDEEGVFGTAPVSDKTKTFTQISAASTSAWWFIETAFLSAPQDYQKIILYKIEFKWSTVVCLLFALKYVCPFDLNCLGITFYHKDFDFKTCRLESWMEHPPIWAISTKNLFSEKDRRLHLMPPILLQSHQRHQWWAIIGTRLHSWCYHGPLPLPGRTAPELGSCIQRSAKSSKANCCLDFSGGWSIEWKRGECDIMWIWLQWTQFFFLPNNPLFNHHLSLVFGPLKQQPEDGYQGEK